jgi:hypothetical protein
VRPTGEFEGSFLIAALGDDPRDFVVSLDCWIDPFRDCIVVLYLRRLGTDGTGYGKFMRLSLPERTVLIGLGTEQEKEGPMANTERFVSER